MEFHDARPSESPRAFTILEVVVVLAAITVLMALLVPAVQQSREASRNAMCINNLRQVGIAAHSVVDVTGRFPGQDYAWSLLPHLEQASLFERTRDKHYVFASLEQLTRNPMLADARIPVYACASDDSQSIVGGRALSYLLNRGSLFGGESDGMLNRYKSVAPSEVTDGLSNTTLFAEKLLYAGRAVQYVPDEFLSAIEKRRRMAYTEAFWGATNREAFVNACLTYPVWLAGSSFDGDFITILGTINGSSGYNHLMPPNSNSCYNGLSDSELAEGFQRRFGATAATSLHREHVNVLLADGSVNGFADSVSIRVWTAIGSRSGGEVPE